MIGEVVAGILLGPSLLGWILPAAQQFLLPNVSRAAFLQRDHTSSASFLYMFLIGLELNPGTLKEPHLHGR